MPLFACATTSMVPAGLSLSVVAGGNKAGESPAALIIDRPNQGEVSNTLTLSVIAAL